MDRDDEMIMKPEVDGVDFPQRVFLCADAKEPSAVQTMVFAATPAEAASSYALYHAQQTGGEKTVFALDVVEIDNAVARRKIGKTLHYTGKVIVDALVKEVADHG